MRLEDILNEMLEEVYGGLDVKKMTMEELVEHMEETLEEALDELSDKYNKQNKKTKECCDNSGECFHDIAGAMVSDEENEQHDNVNHPLHYASSGMECIDEMILLYGEEETMSFCKLNSHKYRKRALDKGGKQDQLKSDWYLAKYKELKEIVEMRKCNEHARFMNDMHSFLSKGAMLDIENPDFIALYNKYFSN